MKQKNIKEKKIVTQILKICLQSRFASLLGRKEVLTGKASFGIFGDGVELPQAILAQFMQPGDFRTGYYRDQTLEFALGNITISQFFSQLYADTQFENEPGSRGRQMNCHFATPFLNDNSEFLSLTKKWNTASDISPTGGQMARLLGLAYASKLFRQNPELQNQYPDLSFHGNEIVVGSIGDASTSEGLFFETMNAAGVLQVPLVMNVWDNGYGISVPRQLQTVNNSISKALSGFASSKAGEGFALFKVTATDYEDLFNTYKQATEIARTEHKPVLVHVVDVTQPQGHSTSGSHERYKTKERLDWEKENCCLEKFKQWILKHQILDQNEINKIEDEEKSFVKKSQEDSYQKYLKPIHDEWNQVQKIYESCISIQSNNKVTTHELTLSKIKKHWNSLISAPSVYRGLIQSTIAQILFEIYSIEALELQFKELKKFYFEYLQKNKQLYSSHLYSESEKSPLNKIEIKPIYNETSEMVDGRLILLRCFDHHFKTNPLFFAFGEDVGQLGDVNLVFEGLQQKYSNLRITDTGIREATILGQGIGCAMRGLRPLVDIQYLDYFLYALQTASDDLATLHYRTAGKQKAPVIIRTKGHRLEGIWHTGSPMGVLLNSLRGLYICVPRNMIQAAGMYNTLLASDNPALVIEVLNGYRLKEKCPANLSEIQVPLGQCEILKEGHHITLVTYGACVRIALQAAQVLEEKNISLEIIDVQTLIPFDLTGIIKKSIEKTNAILFLDEDVPGGASSYMMQQVLENQKSFDFLDVRPRTLTSSENRVSYGRDGDYFGKPQTEDILKICLTMMNERNRKDFPSFC